MTPQVLSDPPVIPRRLSTLIEAARRLPEEWPTLSDDLRWTRIDELAQGLWSLALVKRLNAYPVFTSPSPDQCLQRLISAVSALEYGELVFANSIIWSIRDSLGGDR